MEPILRIKEDRERRIRLEEYLDQSYGSCELALPGVAQRMENILLYDDHAESRPCVGRNRKYAHEQTRAELEETRDQFRQRTLRPQRVLVAGRLLRPLHSR